MHRLNRLIFVVNNMHFNQLTTGMHIEHEERRKKRNQGTPETAQART